MGRVLINFDPDLFVARLSLNEEDAKLLRKHVFDSPCWVMLDWGYMTNEEAILWMSQQLPEHLRKYVPQLVNHWHDPIIRIEGMEEVVSEVREQGYKIYLLSNAGPQHHDYWERIPGSQYFDGKVVSAYEKLMKPQREIYGCLLKRYNLKAEECLFIDDYPPNILSAQLMGIQSVVFEGTAQLREQLQAYLK